VTDGNSAISIELPVEWQDIDDAPWTDDTGQIIGASITAAPDLNLFNTSFETPGVFFSASTSLASVYDTTTLLDSAGDFSDVCTPGGRSDYSDGNYTGVYDIYENCGGVSATWVNLSVTPSSGGYIILLQVRLVSDADLEALKHILTSIQVIGSLP
jgi:serine protease Do